MTLFGTQTAPEMTFEAAVAQLLSFMETRRRAVFGKLILDEDEFYVLIVQAQRALENHPSRGEVLPVLNAIERAHETGLLVFGKTSVPENRMKELASDLRTKSKF